MRGLLALASYGAALDAPGLSASRAPGYEASASVTAEFDHSPQADCRGARLSSAALSALGVQESCFVKCGQRKCNEEPCFCEGYSRSVDLNANSFAVCLPVRDLQRVCLDLGDACHSFTIEGGNGTRPNRGFLNGPSCGNEGAIRPAKHGLYVKRHPAAAECPLGVAIVVSGSHVAAGVYEMDLGSTSKPLSGGAARYRQRGAEPLSFTRHELRWDKSGCGFVLGHSTPVAVAAPPAPCPDLPVLAAGLLGVEPDSQRGLEACRADFCDHPVFRRVCPTTCGVEDCESDADDAVGNYQVMVGQVVDPIAKLGAEIGRCRETSCSVKCGDAPSGLSAQQRQNWFRTCEELPLEDRVCPYTWETPGHWAQISLCPCTCWKEINRAPRPWQKLLAEGDQTWPGKEYNATMTECQAAASAGFCEDPVVLTLCKGTCKFSTRRLSARLEGTDWRGRLAQAAFGLRRRLAREPRRLEQAEASFTEWFALFDPVLCDAGTGAAGTPPAPRPPAVKDVPQYVGGAVYDLYSFTQRISSGVEWDYHCPLYEESYETQAGKFCPVRNLAVASDHLCSSKCQGRSWTTLKHGWVPPTRDIDGGSVFIDQSHRSDGSDTRVPTSPSQDNAWNWDFQSMSGTEPDHCLGHVPGHPLEADALCLPREDCEALCSSLPFCHSIDMHKWLPRCFLNSMECAEEAAVDRDHQYDLLVPASRRVRYATQTYQNCTRGDVVLMEADLDRHECEQMCNARDDCTGITLIWPSSSGPAEPGDRPRCVLSKGGCAEARAGQPFSQAIPHRVIWDYNATVNVSFNYSQNHSWNTSHVIYSTEHYNGSTTTNTSYTTTTDVTDVNGTVIGQTTHTYYHLVTTTVPKTRTVNHTEIRLNEGVLVLNSGYSYLDARDTSLHFTHNWLYATKSPARPCKVEVTDLEHPEHNGIYFQLNEGTFRKPDNTSRLEWQVDPHRCGGWALQDALTQPAVTLYECSDDKAAASAYASNAGRFVCEFLADDGQCTDPVVAALCAYSCHDLQHVDIGGRRYETQDPAACRRSHATGVKAYAFTRGNATAVSGLRELSKPGGLRELTCEAMHGFGLCDHSGHKAVLLKLCPAECARAPAGPEIHERTVTYVDGSDAGEWVDRMRTYPRQGPFVSQGPCASPVTRNAPDVTLVATQATYKAAFDTVPLAAALECAQESECGELSQCVLSDQRHAAELQRTTGGLPHAAALDEAPRPSELGCAPGDAREACGALANVHFFPRTLVSRHRVDAFVVASKWGMAGPLQRAGAGAERVELVSFTHAAAKARIVVASPLEDQGQVARYELGRTFALPKDGYDQFVTDVVRLELFDHAGRFVAGEAAEPTELWDTRVSLKVYAPLLPGQHLAILGARAGEQLARADAWGASVTALGHGWWRLTLPDVSADYVGVSDTLECAAGPCPAHAQCLERVGLPPVCECEPPYVPKGERASSVVGPKACVVPAEVYEAGASEYRLVHTNRLDFGWALAELRLFADLGCVTPVPPEKILRVRTSDAAGDAAQDPAALLMDGDEETVAWRSRCVQCNPGRIRGGQGRALWRASPDTKQTAYVAVTLAGDAHVRCVRVGGSTARGLRIERRPACADPEQWSLPCARRAGLTAAWDVPVLTPSDLLAQMDRFVTSTMSTTEAPVPDVASSVEGANMTCGLAGQEIVGELLEEDGVPVGYFPSVPGPCECAELCWDWATRGCVNWRFASASGECYLQSSIWRVDGLKSDEPATTTTTTTYFDIESSIALPPGLTAPPSPAPFVPVEAEDRQWISGRLGFHVADWSGTAEVGEPFTLTLHGQFAASEAKEFNAAYAARVKLVEYSPLANCDSPVPEQVVGVGCEPLQYREEVETQSRTAPTWRHDLRGAETTSICGPAPKEAGHTEASFDVTIGQGDIARFVVCACLGRVAGAPGTECGPAGSFRPVGDILEVAAARRFRYEVEDPPVRHQPFRLVAAREPFASFSNASDWQLKLVWHGFGCGGDSPAAAAAGAPLGPDEVAFSVTSAQAGKFDVCLSETPDFHVEYFPPLHVSCPPPNCTRTSTATPLEPVFHLVGSPLRIQLEETTFSGFAHAHYLSAQAGAAASLRVEQRGLSPQDAQSKLLLVPAVDAGDVACGHLQLFAGPEPTVLKAAYPDAASIEFSGTVADLPGGRYAACVCRAKDVLDRDGNPVTLGTTTSTTSFAPTSTSSTTSGAVDLDLYALSSQPSDLWQPWTYAAAGRPLACQPLRAAELNAGHQELTCTQLCSRGCIGSGCYCDGFERAAPGALCVPPPRCSELCDATAGCAGFGVVDSFCYLYTCAASAVHELDVVGADGRLAPFQFARVEADLADGEPWLRRTYGRVCTTPAEYDVQVGHVLVTARVQTGADFVVDPEKVATIEVAGVLGDLSSDLGVSEDRIMIVDAEGTCGLSPPTAMATAVLGDVAQGPSGKLEPAQWAALAPISGEGISVQPDGGIRWVYREYSYCASSNMDPAEYPALYEHQCFPKCILNDCEGDDCHCDGALPGYDTPDTRALCIPESTCLKLCAGLEDCVAVDMHLTKPRCFLNAGAGCAATSHEDLISESDYYRLIWKQRDHADDGSLDIGKGPVYTPNLGRRAQARELSSIARDLGYSWPSLLRFPVSIHAPGEYKVCFCDSALVEAKGSGVKCETERDFGVLVGTVRASGVACLIEESKFRRSSSNCVEMYHGGLRCGVATPAFPTTPAGPELPSMADTETVGALWSSCLLRPERAGEAICHALQHFYGTHHLVADITDAKTVPQ